MWNIGFLVLTLVSWRWIEFGTASMPPSRMRWWLRLVGRVCGALLVVIWVLLLFA